MRWEEYIASEPRFKVVNFEPHQTLNLQTSKSFKSLYSLLHQPLQSSFEYLRNKTSNPPLQRYFRYKLRNLIETLETFYERLSFLLKKYGSILKSLEGFIGDP